MSRKTKRNPRSDGLSTLFPMGTSTSYLLTTLRRTACQCSACVARRKKEAKLRTIPLTVEKTTNPAGTANHTEAPKQQTTYLGNDMQTQTQTQAANESDTTAQKQKVSLRVYEIVKALQPVTASDVTELMEDNKTSASSTLSKLAKCGYLLVDKSPSHVSKYTGAPTGAYRINPDKPYNGEALPSSFVLNNGYLRRNNQMPRQIEILTGKTITQSIYLLVSKHQPVTAAEVTEMTRGRLNPTSVSSFMSQLASAGYLATVKREGSRGYFYITTSKQFAGTLPVLQTKRKASSNDNCIEYDDAELSVATEAPITPPQLEAPKPQPVNGVLKKKVVVTYEFMGKEYTEDELREVMAQLQSALGD